MPAAFAAEPRFENLPAPNLPRIDLQYLRALQKDIRQVRMLDIIPAQNGEKRWRSRPFPCETALPSIG